jgi:hypothetical protein
MKKKTGSKITGAGEYGVEKDIREKATAAGLFDLAAR